MTQSHHMPESRREWLAACARWTVLGGLAAGTGVLALRGQIAGEPGDCRKPIACRDCAAWGGCGLPRARRAQQERT